MEVYMIRTPKDYKQELILRVLKGTAHVITAEDYKKLPAYLKVRYYPLFNYGATPYRLKPQYIRIRVTPDPNRVSFTLTRPRPAYVPPQMRDWKEGEEFQPAGKFIKTVVTVPNTPLSKKSLPVLMAEARQLAKNRIGVKTQYSRY